MPISIRSLLPLAVAATFVPALQAQGTLTPVLTRAFSSPSYTDLAFGHVYGNGEPVLIALNNGAVDLLVEPAAFDGRSTLSTGSSVTSITVQRSSTPGAIEDVLLADASGLVRVRCTTEWGLEAPVLLLGGAWQNALELEARDMGGVPIVLGLDAARSQVISAIDLGGGLWANLFTLAAPVGETILGFAALDYDDDGGMEVAFLTEEDLWVVEQDGTPLLILRSWGGNEGALAAVVDGGGERLAWATKNAGGTPVLKVLNAAGGETPRTLVVPVVENDPAQAIQIGRLVAGDLDGDGNQDLVLKDRGSCRDLVMYNRGAPAHFTLASLGTDHCLVHTDPANPYASGAANTAPPVLGDMLGIGAKGVYFALNSIGSIVVDPGTQGNSGNCNGSIDYGSCFVSNASTHDYSGNSTVVNLAMVLPPSVTENYTHVQTVLWVQPTEGGPMDSYALSNQLHPFYYDASAGEYTAEQWIQLTVPEALGAGNDWETRQYYLRYRFVTANTGVTPPVVTSFSAGFRSGIDSGDTLYLATQQTAGSVQVNFAEVASTPVTPSGGNGSTAGTFIYTDVQPPTAMEPQAGSLVLVPGNGNAPW